MILKYVFNADTDLFLYIAKQYLKIYFYSVRFAWEMDRTGKLKRKRSKYL